MSASSMSASPTLFPVPGTAAELESVATLTPKFDSNGLITAVVADAATREILMLAHMNGEALARTIATREAWYWSRSRASLWRKGESSGHTQAVVAMRVDCDQDAVLLLVRQSGPACHTGRTSCFYREVTLGTGAGEPVGLALPG